MSITIQDLRAWKSEGRRFAMLTAYDYTTAKLLDEAGIPVLLVGDTLAEVVLGHTTTLPVTMDEMLHHCRAVARGAQNALVVGDMPFGAYQTSVEDGIRNGARYLKEAGAHAGKFEGALPELPGQPSTPPLRIGARPHCDGQVLVVNDVLGLSDRTPPKFVKRYANVREQVLAAAGEFKREVEEGT